MREWEISLTFPSSSSFCTAENHSKRRKRGASFFLFTKPQRALLPLLSGVRSHPARNPLWVLVADFWPLKKERPFRVKPQDQEKLGAGVKIPNPNRTPHYPRATPGLVGWGGKTCSGSPLAHLHRTAETFLSVPCGEKDLLKFCSWKLKPTTEPW